MRVHLFSVLSLASVAVCSAGQIQIGQVNGSGQNLGLTYAYITGTGGCAPGVASCVAGAVGGNSTGPGLGTTGFIEKNYDNRLFSGATQTSVAPTPFAGYSTSTATAAGTQLGQFAMISDGTASSASNNFWDGTTASTMTIPIGIANVGDVQTLLDNIWGLQGNANETVVTFNFGTTSNATIFNNILEVDLQNSGTPRSAPSGQIGSGVDCDPAIFATCGSNNLASGPLAPSSTPTTKLNSVLLGTGVTVTTANLFTSGNTYNTAGGTQYGSTSGNLSLYSQNFLVGSIVAPSLNEYLVSITVQEKLGNGNQSQTALSAITVDTVPEPSTVFLFIGGLGALGLARFRRKQ